MQKKIVAVNAGPRKGWNTDTLITEASRGAESAGAEQFCGSDRGPDKRRDAAAQRLQHYGLAVDAV